MSLISKLLNVLVAFKEMRRLLFIICSVVQTFENEIFLPDV